MSILRAAVAAAALTSGGFATAGAIDPAVAGTLAMRPVGAIRVLIQLRDPASLDDHMRAVQNMPPGERPGRLAAALRERFGKRAEPLMARLQALGGQDMHALWLVDGIAAEMPRSKVRDVAAWPEVERVELDMALRAQQVVRPRSLPRAAMAADAAASAALAQSRLVPQAPADALASSTPWLLPEHMASLDVPRAWQAGFAGQGMTVAVIDSGVDLRTPALTKAYRGGAHDWLDPYGQHQLPHDGQGHGTLVASLLVGRALTDMPIGIAPHARFIAARLFDDSGHGRLSAVHRIYQWMLDPDGRAETADAPHVVNNSWGFAQTTDQCNLSLHRVWQAYRAVGIPVVFAAGNDGPFPRTSMSPANNAGVISVAALDADGRLARQSSRGPSACTDVATGQPVPFPTLHAPGVALPTLDRAGSTMGVVNRSDGTSFAAALASGALLLLRQAQPDASVDDLLARVARHAAHGDEEHPPIAQLGATLVRPGSAPIRPAQRFEMEAKGEVIRVDAGALARALPRGVALTRVQVDEAGRAAVDAEQAGSTAVVWRPGTQAGASLRLQLALSDGSQLPLELAVAAPPAQAGDQVSSRVLAGRRDTPLVVDVPALLGRAADLKALTWSQPLRGGRLERGEDGSLRYRPPHGFVGTDQFALRGGPQGDLAVKVLVRP